MSETQIRLLCEGNGAEGAPQHTHGNRSGDDGQEQGHGFESRLEGISDAQERVHREGFEDSSG